MRGKFFHRILLAAVSCAAFTACQTPLSAPANGDAGGATEAASAICYSDDDCGPGRFCNYAIHPCGNSFDSRTVVNFGGECHALVCAGPGCSKGFQCGNSLDCDPFSSCGLVEPMVCEPLPIYPDRPVCAPDCALVHPPYASGYAWVCLCPHC
jgi:hypothetical protein